MDDLRALVDAVEKESGERVAAEEVATTRKGELDAAKAVVDEKQAAWDGAKGDVGREKSEEIAALRALLDAVQAKIAALEEGA